MGRPRAAAPRLGPLLAVCGLTGGAGTTTLAYLVAHAATARGTTPVLVADTGGPSGGLAALTGVEVAHTLPELAYQLTAGRKLNGALYATGQDGVRVLASGPEFGSRADPARVTTLLADAREAHALTVLDCGTLGRDIDWVCASAATHVAWVLPATTDGASRGERVLASVPAIAGIELLVARAATDGAKAPLGALRRLAADRHVPLMLVPDLPGLDTGRLDRAAEVAQVALQAILGVLGR
jgi:MinD-like ATPase involved in chromosome partitioning or flagellar assembly